MAASMIWKGLCRARGMCVTQHELDMVHTLHKPQCRYRKTATAVTHASRAPVKKYVRQAPIHSIYIMEDYPTQKFSFEQCIDMHKEAAQPAMTNSLHTQIYADIQLNFVTNKKTKFMKKIRGLLEYPHKFEHNQKTNIYAFSESPTDWELCRELGATQAGGDDIINFIIQGIIRKVDIDDCDFIFATPAMSVKLLKQRGKLLEKTPTLSNGCVTNDFEGIIKRHMEGVKYKSHRESDAVGLTQIPFGQLNQDTEELEENFMYMVSVLTGLKPNSQVPLLQNMRLIAPPSTEIFELDFTHYVQAEGGTNKSGYSDSDEED